MSSPRGTEFEPAGYGALSVGNYDFQEVKAGITGTLIDETLAGRLDIVQSERDGFFDDIGTGDEYNDRDRLLLRGQLLWQPTQALSFRFIADYAEREESCCAAVTYIKGATAPVITALGGKFSTGDEFERNSATTPGRDFDEDMDEKGYGLHIDWEGDDFSLTSITSWRDWEASRSQDPDFTTLDLIVRGDSAFQLNTYNGLNFIVTSLSEVNARGIEIESTYLAARNWLLQGGVSWNDTEYENPVRDASGTEQTQLSGKALTNAPEWAISGAITYNTTLDSLGLDGFVHMDVRWTDNLNTGSDLDAEKKQEDFVVVNGRVGIGSPDASWQLELWGHNLFDEDYYQVAFDAALQTGTFNAFLAEPRTWGVTLRAGISKLLQFCCACQSGVINPANLTICKTH